jgi:drug/metabolite transporter (DMT)-like permease
MSAKALQLAGLLITPFVIAIGQILFKLASEQVSLNEPRSLALNPYLWSALVLYGSATIAWVFVIRDIPISRAYMFMALTFVFVPFLSFLFLKEPLNIRLMLGVGIILAGIYVSFSG